MRPIDKYILEPLDIDKLGPIIESVMANAMFSWVSGGLSSSTSPFLSFVGKGLNFSQNPIGSVLGMEPFATANTMVMEHFEFITDPIADINSMGGDQQDFISGDGGDDLLIGGGGQDIYFMGRGFGNDRIRSFV
ncbi:MAG: hypothetical protein HQL85_19545 [Magnetococcales bacterium]|nr:hypothetical protein [Magnetococcales bacterium]